MPCAYIRTKQPDKRVENKNMILRVCILSSINSFINTIKFRIMHKRLLSMKEYTQHWMMICLVFTIIFKKKVPNTSFAHIYIHKYVNQHTRHSHMASMIMKLAITFDAVASSASDKKKTYYCFCLSFKYSRCDNGFVKIHTSPTGLKYFVSQSRPFSLRIFASSRCFCSSCVFALVARSMSLSRRPAVTSSQMRRDSCTACSLIGRTIFL